METSELVNTRDIFEGVSVVELSRPSASLPEILSGIGSYLAGADRTLKELLNDVASSDGIQARMDGMSGSQQGYGGTTRISIMTFCSVQLL
ncbi:hypothetical protein KY285_017719 [Solanum tuberosum]|nr:hypothetical protein KY285_017719 [Solanum tuberosum]